MAKHNWWLVFLIVIALENTALSQTTDTNPSDLPTEELSSLSTALPQIYNLSVIDDIQHESVSTSTPIITRKIRIDIPIDSTEYTTITSENYPLPYPDTAFDVEWTIGFGSGHGVELIIRDMDLDGESQDNVLIRPGGLDLATEDELVFTWILKEERKYRLIHLNELYIKFHTMKKTGKKNKGFKIDVKQIRENPTTIAPPTTVEPPVTVKPRQEAQMYLKGIAPAGFLNISQPFKNNLAIVAEKYCIENNITVDNLTILDNVNYHQINSCPFNWPYFEICVHITYSIPVHFDNETEAYELTTEHLDDMWLRYSKFMNLTSLGLQVYPTPNDDHIFIVWVGISIGVVLFFLLIFFLIWKYGLFYEYIRKDSLRSSLVSNQKDSVASFFPTPHQPVPPIFGMDSFADDKYWYDDELPPRYSIENPSNFEPGKMGRQNLGYSQDSELFDLDSDEEIIMSLPETHVKDQSTLRMSGAVLDSSESNL